jgi:Glycosyltransferase family 87
LAQKVTPTPRVAGATTTTTANRRTLLLIVGPLGILIVLWVYLLFTVGGVTDGPRARTFGGDFALNMASASVLQHGGNPYDGRGLLSAERSLMEHQGIHTDLGSSSLVLTWGGYPPLYFWLLRPLLALPFRVVAVAWILGLYVCMGIGFLAALKYAGWKHRVIPCLLFLGMPQAALAAYYANPTPLVFAVMMLALLLQRTRPFASGLLFSLTCLKPQLAIVGFVLLVGFHVTDRRWFTLGVGVGATVLLAVSAATCGLQSLTWWLHGLNSVSSMIGRQPNIAPLIGLYAGWAPTSVRVGLEMSVLAIACVLTFGWWRRMQNTPEVTLISVAWLWVVWFLALPYAHFPDEILLCLPVLALLGPDARNSHRWAPALVPYLMYFSALLFSAKFHDAQLLSLPLIALAAVLFRAARSEVTAFSQDSPARQTA